MPYCLKHPDAPDISVGRYWRRAVRIESVYGNAYRKGACALAELPVEDVTVQRRSA